MIKLIRVSKSFGEQKVLDKLDLTIEKGKTTVIVGRSGVGKSVLLKHMIGLIEPDEGSVIVDDVDITKLGLKELNKIRRKFGMLFQEAALFDSLNVFENVAFPLREHTRLSEEEIEKRVTEKLHLVGLEEDVKEKFPSELSGGMKKRVGLARAIALDPEILLFDEPTTGLDPIMAATIDSLIINAHKTLNLTCVVISHDIPSAFRIAHKICMLHDGKIIFEGSVDEFENSDNEIVQKFLRAQPEV